jgi:hypothetical protein
MSKSRNEILAYRHTFSGDNEISGGAPNAGKQGQQSTSVSKTFSVPSQNFQDRRQIPAEQPTVSHAIK